MGQPDSSLDPSDEDLFLAYGQGDEAAFGVLYARYGKKLFSFLLVRLGAGQSQLSDELFQKTWLKVHLARQSFDPSKRFSTWFFTIALNALRDVVGSASEKNLHMELSEDLASHSMSSSEEECIRRDLIVQIHTFLTTLPESQRTALLLSDEEGLSSQEVSEVMGLSDGAVRQLIRRARKAVRAQFSEDSL